MMLTNNINKNTTHTDNPAWQNQLSKLRGKNSQDIRRKLSYLIRILYLHRENINGINFSELDLNGQVLYPYFLEKSEKVHTNFTGAKVYGHNFSQLDIWLMFILPHSVQMDGAS
jgi:uncharacterized protein YjbI with pentapeptide repeats